MEIKAMDKFGDKDNTQMLNRRLTELERLVHEYEKQTTYLSEQKRNVEDVLCQKDILIKDNEERCNRMAYELAELKEQLLEKDEAVKDLEVSNTNNYLTDKIDCSNLLFSTSVSSIISRSYRWAYR